MKRIIFLFLIFTQFLLADFPSPSCVESAGDIFYLDSGDYTYTFKVAKDTVSEDVHSENHGLTDNEYFSDKTFYCFRVIDADNFHRDYTDYSNIEECSKGEHYSFSDNKCEPPPECTPDPKPAGLAELDVFSTTDDGVTGIDQCLNAISSNGDCKDVHGNKFVNCLCWTDSCASDLGKEATLFGKAGSNDSSDDNNESSCLPPKILDTSSGVALCLTYDELLNSDTLDSDGDGIPNADDIDFDGDGIPNQYDNIFGSGTLNGDSDSSGLEGLSCSELDAAYAAKCENLLGIHKFIFECSTTRDGLPYITKNECLEKPSPCVKIIQDFQSNCRAPKIIHGGCYFDLDTGEIDNNLTCDTPDPDMSPCDVARNNLRLTCKYPSYIAGQCHDSYGVIIGENTYHCVENNSTSGDDGDDNDDGSSSDDDDNSSGTVQDNDSNLTVNLNPLIQANNQNTDKITSHIDKVEKNTRKTNDKLTAIDSKLATLIKNTSNTELNTISKKLSTTNSNLNDIRSNTNSIVKNSASIVGNTAQISSNTALTAANTATTNSKLQAIVDSVEGFKNGEGNLQEALNALSSNPNQLNIDSKGIDDSSSFLDNLEENMAYLTEDVTSIKDQFTDLKNLLEGDDTQLQLSTGSCSNENINKFASIISPYSAVFALITYVSFMIQIFKMIFAYFSRGDN